MRCRILSYCALGMLLTGTVLAADKVVKLSLTSGVCVVSDKAAHLNNGDGVTWMKGSGIFSSEITFKVSPFKPYGGGGGTYTDGIYYPLGQNCKRTDGIGCAYPYIVKIKDSAKKEVTCDPDIIIDPMEEPPAAAASRTPPNGKGGARGQLKSH